MATLGLKGMGKFLQTQGSHSKVHWENAKRSLMKSGLNAMPLFLLDNLLRHRKFVGGKGSKMVKICRVPSWMVPMVITIVTLLTTV